MTDQEIPYPFEFHTTDVPDIVVSLRIRQSTAQWFVERYGDHWRAEIAAALEECAAERKAPQ